MGTGAQGRKGQRLPRVLLTNPPHGRTAAGIPRLHHNAPPTRWRLSLSGEPRHLSVDSRVLLGERRDLSEGRADLLGERRDLLGQRCDLSGQLRELSGGRHDLLGERRVLSGQRRDLSVERRDLTFKLCGPTVQVRVLCH